MKRILLCVTGSIAIIKIPLLIKIFKENNYNVTAVLSNSAQKFITKLTFQALIGKENVYHDDDLFANEITHINLSRNADCIVIAPATMNIIGKIANGICDDLITNIIAGNPKEKPVFVAPAMNKEMWSNKANQRNIDTLTNDGFCIINPIIGEQACGEFGLGKMEEPENIFKIMNDKIKN